MDHNLKQISNGLDGLVKGLDKMLNDTLKNMNPEQAKELTEALKNANVNEKIEGIKKQQRDLKNSFNI